MKKKTRTSKGAEAVLVEAGLSAEAARALLNDEHLRAMVEMAVRVATAPSKRKSKGE